MKSQIRILTPHNKYCDLGQFPGSHFSFLIHVQSCPNLCNSMDCEASQGPLSMGFFRQEYWSGEPLPLPEIFPTHSTALKVDSLPSEPPGKTHVHQEEMIVSSWYQIRFGIWNFLIVKHYMLAAEKAMAPHSSTLAWKIPWTEEPGWLQSMGSLRVGHDWMTSLSLFTFMHWRRKRQPTPVFLPAESQGRGSLVAADCGIKQSRTWLKWLSSSRHQL